MLCQVAKYCCQGNIIRFIRRQKVKCAVILWAIMAYVATCVFREPAKSYYLDPGELDILTGDRVVGETSRGIEIGTVKFRAREMEDDKIAGPLRRILRLATKDDLRCEGENAGYEAESLQLIRDCIERHGLQMKPVKVEITLDRSKLFFFYESETRVDFRELLRELSSELSIRLQFQQVNAREAAKVLGGCGPCGQTLCCSTWLDAMPPVTLKMAKEQNLALTPHKISGACGRLMCCLRYEIDFYRDQKQRLPRNGTPVDTPEGPGHVRDVNYLSEDCVVELGDGRRITLPGETLRQTRKERGPVRACSNHVDHGGSCEGGK